MKKNQKQNEKEIYNLQVKVGNFEDTTKKIKEEIIGKNRELKNLKKEVRKVEKNEIKLLKMDSKSQLNSKSSKAASSFSSTLNFSATDASPNTTSLTPTTSSSSAVIMSSVPYSSSLSLGKDNKENSSYLPASQDNSSQLDSTWQDE